MFELKAIVKSYQGRVVNSHIHFQLEKNSIHALIGENGAGKSTLMKIAYGLVQPDSGEIILHGNLMKWGSPRDAMARGIGMVHQHFMLADNILALDHFLLDRAQRNMFSILERKKTEEDLQGHLDLFGVTLSDLNTMIRDLPVGVQQRIEILRLLYRNSQILILDEPTAVLTPQEVDSFFEKLLLLKNQGKAIVLITHKLKEVLAIADKVTVLSNGKTVGDIGVSVTKNMKLEELAEKMIGRPWTSASHAFIENSHSKGALAQGIMVPLEISGFSYNPKKGIGLSDLKLVVGSGQIVGIAGVEGNGQQEVIKAILQPALLVEEGKKVSGEIKILGHTVFSGQKCMSTKKIRAMGVGVIPADRHHEGLLLQMSVLENYRLGITSQLNSHRDNKARKILGSLKNQLSISLRNYDIRPPEAQLPVKNFSGGNQQKLIVARELDPDPKLILAIQPTRGVDVGAIENIHLRLREAKVRGAGILLISSELEEILDLSDQIFVMYRGRFVLQIDFTQKQDQFSVTKKIGLAMGGVV